LSTPPPPQVAGEAQVPQFNVAPQPSGTVPQFLPCETQVVFGHPQTWGVPLPPQVLGEVHEPQSSVLLQPSETDPQLSPSAVQVVATHVLAPQTFALPPPPQLPVEHVPQSSVPPQPSGIVPQFRPSAVHEAFVQPHALGVPAPPHVSGAVQVPQVTVVPQFVVASPQLFPAQAVARSGVQPQTFDTPPPPHVSGDAQEPHCSIHEHPSEIAPQFLPWSWQDFGVQVPAAHTFAIPPPPQVFPGVHDPQETVPPQPSSARPQFFESSRHVFGVQPPTLASGCDVTVPPSEECEIGPVTMQTLLAHFAPEAQSTSPRHSYAQCPDRHTSDPAHDEL
jgi:hypothetical protein